MSRIPAARTLPRLVEELAHTFGPRPALSGGGRHLTYVQMRDEVWRIARRLHRLGVRHGDKVGILMGNRVEWVTSCLAITSLGAVMVSLNTWATVRELEYMLAHSETRTLIAYPSFLKADYGAMLRELEPHAERLPHLREILGTDATLPEGWNSRSEPGIGAPVVMPHLGEDLVGSMLQEADIANFFAEFEAELDA